MKDILSARTLLSARLGFDITDYHVISYFKLENESIRAAMNGNLNVIQYISSLGFDVHAFYCDKKYSNHLTPDGYLFKISAARGHLNVVRYLVEQGANIHAQDDLALISAAYNGSLDVVQYLVEQGANIHAQDDDALILAAYDGYLDVVQYLVEQGANIHAQNDIALRILTINKHWKVVEYLESLGEARSGAPSPTTP